MAALPTVFARGINAAVNGFTARIEDAETVAAEERASEVGAQSVRISDQASEADLALGSVREQPSRVGWYAHPGLRARMVSERTVSATRSTSMPAASAWRRMGSGTRVSTTAPKPVSLTTSTSERPAALIVARY
jgi:hypothetical protein